MTDIDYRQAQRFKNNSDRVKSRILVHTMNHLVISFDQNENHFQLNCNPLILAETLNLNPNQIVIDYFFTYLPIYFQFKALFV
ncbi:unnamed protein product [Paramecium sonneborni]|uniref:Uncharacterized protein n=1 Tax=Paramecium sonneborni TaxID=65129 RepID=A0A8S1RNG0_9CILI|nr:unnamed protein product [Paramecium sonneborni]